MSNTTSQQSESATSSGKKSSASGESERARRRRKCLKTGGVRGSSRASLGAAGWAPSEPSLTRRGSAGVSSGAAPSALPPFQPFFFFWPP